MYKIGDKVETKLGVGIIKEVIHPKNYKVVFERGLYDDYTYFFEDSLKPHTSAHEKLLALGYRISQTTALTNSLYTIYEKDGSSITIIERKSGNTYKTRQEVSLELVRIMVQYLEELE